MHETPHDAISFHLAKLLNEHLFRHGRARTAQLGKPSHVATKQVKEDHELPSASENTQHILDAFRGGCDRVFLLTFR
jgi:hypothetical protein